MRIDPPTTLRVAGHGAVIVMDIWLTALCGSEFISSNASLLSKVVITALALCGAGAIMHREFHRMLDALDGAP